MALAGERPVRRPSARDGALALLIGALCGLLVQTAHVVTGHVDVNLDHGVHYHYAREYAAAMAAGDLWPRWAMRAQNGLGEPGLLYYSPLYYWLSGLVSRITGTVWAAMQIVEIAASALLGYFSFRLTAIYVPARRALLAPVLACLSPMLAMLQLEFNGYPWGCATAPLAAYFLAILRPRATRMLFNAPAIVALALTVMMHTVSGLMAVIVTAPLALCGLVGEHGPRLDWRRLAAPFVTIAGGLALSAVYLLPAVTLQSLIDPDYWRTAITPANGFSLPTITAARFGVRWFAFQWPISLAMIAAAVLALWMLWRQDDDRLRPLRLPISLIVGAAIFLATEPSYPLWMIDSPLRNIQFPHRFLTILTPLLPLLVLAPKGGRRWMRPALALLVLGGVAMSLLTIVKAAFIEGKTPDLSERTFPPYNGLPEYRTRWTPLGATSTVVAATGSDCVNGRLACTTPERVGGLIQWRVTATRADRYTLPIYYFPAWAVTVDGREVATGVEPATGLARAELPAGRMTVDFAWRPLAQERIGFWISVATALGLLLVMALRRLGPAPGPAA